MRSQIGNQSSISRCDFQKILGPAEPCGFKRLCDIEHIEAFRYDERVHVNLPACDSLVDRNYVRAILEQVFAGFERGSAVECVPEHKSMSAADYTCSLQLARDTVSRVSGT